MKIVIDARMLFWTGVGRYTKALLTELEQLDTGHDFWVITRPEDRALWEPTKPNFHRVEAAIDPYTLAEQFKLPGVLRELKPDLVHFTVPNTPLFYNGRKMVSVHDLTLLDYDTSRGTGLKKLIRSLKRWPFRLVLWRNVRTAAGMTTMTRYVKDQLVKRLQADPAKISVTLLSADPNVAAPEPIDRFNINAPYLLYVGNFYPYKNVASTIEALAALSQENNNLKLVIVGKSDYFREVLQTKAAQLGLQNRVIFTGFVTDGELVSLYQKAACYVYPSLSEGFGLQGLEAMAQGLSVVAANASCLPEVYADAAIYFDPHDPADQAQKIKHILNDPALSRQLIAAGKERLKDFSWRRTAEQTLAAYNDALKH